MAVCWKVKSSLSEVFGSERISSKLDSVLVLFFICSLSFSPMLILIIPIFLSRFYFSSFFYNDIYFLNSFIYCIWSFSCSFLWESTTSLIIKDILCYISSFLLMKPHLREYLSKAISITLCTWPWASLSWAGSLRFFICLRGSLFWNVDLMYWTLGRSNGFGSASYCFVISISFYIRASSSSTIWLLAFGRTFFNLSTWVLRSIFSLLEA